MRDPHRRLPQPPSRREMVLRDMASSRQPSPCALSPSRKTSLGYCFRRDGSLSRHHPHWTDVLGSGVLSWHRGSILASWRPTRSLRVGSLPGHVQSRACSAVAENIAIEPPAFPWTQSLKGSTAREANRVLGRRGETFWQAESYEHWGRDEKERERLAGDIENNPAKA